jgi:hypothetical protein
VSGICGRRCSGVAVIAPATGRDRAGAGILTAAWLAAVVGGVGFNCMVPDSVHRE